MPTGQKPPVSAGPLYSPRVVRDLLSAHGLRADKSFGQNFLVDAGVLDSVVRAADIAPDDTVLEIGPGLGVLTRQLAARAGRVVSVELDARLLPILQDTLGQSVEIIQGDGLTFDVDVLPPGSLLVANLPYNVATPILVRALESGRFKRIVVMVQKEVAERLCAEAGSKAYGALSLVVQHYGGATRVRDVKPGAFFPAPEVTSSVVRIDTYPNAEDAAPLLAFIHDAFKHRRKTLRKNLIMAGWDKARVEQVLSALDLDPKVRAEALPLASFRELHKRLVGPFVP